MPSIKNTTVTQCPAIYQCTCVRISDTDICFRSSLYISLRLTGLSKSCCFIAERERGCHLYKFPVLVLMQQWVCEIVGKSVFVKVVWISVVYIYNNVCHAVLHISHANDPGLKRRILLNCYFIFLKQNYFLRFPLADGHWVMLAVVRR